MAAATVNRASSLRDFELRSLDASGVNIGSLEMTELATKINNATQYVFKVHYRPTAAEVHNSEWMVDIPVHAPTMTKALVILHAYGETLKACKTPDELKSKVAMLKYSSVVFGEAEPSGEYNVGFYQYNEHSGKFAYNPHVNCKISANIHNELKLMAETKEADEGAPVTNRVEPEVVIAPSTTSVDAEVLLQPATESRVSEKTQAFKVLKTLVEDRTKNIEEILVQGQESLTKLGLQSIDRNEWTSSAGDPNALWDMAIAKFTALRSRERAEELEALNQLITAIEARKT